MGTSSAYIYMTAGTAVTVTGGYLAAWYQFARTEVGTYAPKAGVPSPSPDGKVVVSARVTKAVRRHFNNSTGALSWRLRQTRFEQLRDINTHYTVPTKKIKKSFQWFHNIIIIIKLSSWWFRVKRPSIIITHYGSSLKRFKVSFYIVRWNELYSLE